MVYAIRRLYIENNFYGRFIFISCNVTELFPSKEMENVPELFQSNSRYGESNGEMNCEIFIHSNNPMQLPGLARCGWEKEASNVGSEGQ